MTDDGIVAYARRSPRRAGPDRRRPELGPGGVAFTSAAEHAGERWLRVRTVTVLFTDLVGSTALSQRRDPAVAEDVHDAHFSAVRDAVDEAGGRVVKNLGAGREHLQSAAYLAHRYGCALVERRATDLLRSL